MTKEQRNAIRFLTGLSKAEVISLWKEAGNFHILHEDERYYFSCFGDKASSDCYSPIHDDIHIASEKCFRTREEMLAQIQFQRSYIKIINRIRELNNGWKPEWKETCNTKFTIAYDHDERGLIVQTTRSFQESPNELYIKDEEIAERLVKELEAEYKLIFAYDNFNWLELE